MGFRYAFDGTMLQLFPLDKNNFFEAGAGEVIDCKKKEAIVFLEAVDIKIDGGIEFPVFAGSTWALNCSSVQVSTAVKYGIV